MTTEKGYRLMKKITQFGLLALVLGSGQAYGDDGRFCGGAVAQSGVASDLAHVVGDQTLEHALDQPAGIMVCSAGYELAKCGDFDSAHKIFDKCIAAGYVGAMIWKATALESGGGGRAPDLAAAAELVHRAALSGDSPYATLGKLHYARALSEGKGVARDEAEARKGFEAAARAGNQEAIAALRAGAPR
jgi:TPR repeat protein